jgi:hypothetical protein
VKEAGVVCNIGFMSAVSESKTKSYFYFNNGKRKCMQIKAKLSECLTFTYKKTGNALQWTLNLDHEYFASCLSILHTSNICICRCVSEIT